MAEKTFTAACREFFGLKPNQKLTEFGQEIKALSYEDKLEIAKGLREVGINCADPVAAA